MKSTRKKRILLAEDDAAMRQYIESALRYAGYDVTSCANGVEALVTLQNSGAFDLLLTDIVMPGLDGLDLSRQAQAQFPDIKIMFITGFSGMAVDVPKGADGQALVIQKPFHLKDVITQVEDLLTQA